MTARTPHPLRCETCDKFDECPETNTCSAFDKWNVTSEVGCASHSSRQTPLLVLRSMREDEDGHVSWQRMNEQALAEHDAAIRAKAREEVLKGLESFCNDEKEWCEHKGDTETNVSTSTGFYARVYQIERVVKKIHELRQQQGGERE